MPEWDCRKCFIFCLWILTLFDTCAVLAWWADALFSPYLSVEVSNPHLLNVFKILLGHGTIGFSICRQKYAYFQKNAVNWGARSCSWVRSSPSTNNKLSRERIKGNPEEKNLGCWWARSSAWAGRVPWQPRKPGLHPKQHVSRSMEMNLPLCFAVWDPHVFASNSGVSNIRTWTCWNESRRPQTILGTATPLLWKQAQGAGVVQEKTRLRWLYSTFQYLKGPRRKLEREFRQGHGVTEQGIVASKWKKVSLD